MPTFDRLAQIADILSSAPAWARLALTSADERVRARGADAVSAFLLRRLEEPWHGENGDQLSLPISG